MEEKKKDSGFVVKDKRFFGESNESQAQEEKQRATKEEKKDETSEKPKETKKEEEKPEESAQQENQETDYPPINFANFVLSLSTSALYHFGDFPDPEGGKTQKNLPAVKQTIDILDMLSEKTKGNLDENESQLIQGALYELKMRFVKEKS